MNAPRKGSSGKSALYFRRQLTVEMALLSFVSISFGVTLTRKTIGQDLDELSIEKRSKVVFLEKESFENEQASMQAAIESQMSAMDVDLVFESLDRSPMASESLQAFAEEMVRLHEADVICWYELSEQSQVYFYSPRLQEAALIVREVHEQPGGGLAEAVALIVQSTIANILKREELRPEPIPPEVEEKTDVQPAPPLLAPKKERLAINIAFAYELYSSEQLVSYGLDMGLSVLLINRLHVFGGYTLVNKLDETGGTATLTLHRHPFRLGLGVLLAQKTKIELVAKGAFLVQYEKQELGDVSPSVSETGDTDDVMLGATIGLALAYQVHMRIILVLSLGAKVLFNPKSYELDNLQGGEEIVMDPWLVQPNASLGVAVPLF